MSHLNDHQQEQYEDFRMLARRATVETLDQPDWELITQCVHIVKGVADAALLAEITQMLRRRLREPQIRVVVLTLYLIDALAHNCGHGLLIAFNDEEFMQQIGTVARKYYISHNEAAAGPASELESRHEVVSVCLELLCNWSQFFRDRRSYYGNIVDMYEILECEGISMHGQQSSHVGMHGIGVAASCSMDATEAKTSVVTQTTGQPSSSSVSHTGNSGINGVSSGNNNSGGTLTQRSGVPSDATTSATTTSMPYDTVRRTESESAAESLPPRSRPDRQSDFFNIRRTESASTALASVSTGRMSKPVLQKSRSRSGDEIHPKKTSPAKTPISTENTSPADNNTTAIAAVMVPYISIKTTSPTPITAPTTTTTTGITNIVVVPPAEPMVISAVSSAEAPPFESMESLFEISPEKNELYNKYHSPPLDIHAGRELAEVESKSDASTSDGATRPSSDDAASRSQPKSAAENTILNKSSDRVKSDSSAEQSHSRSRASQHTQHTSTSQHSHRSHQSQHTHTSHHTHTSQHSQHSHTSSHHSQHSLHHSTTTNSKQAVHTLSRIPESPGGDSGEFGVVGDYLPELASSGELLTEEERQHHSQLQSALASPRALTTTTTTTIANKNTTMPKSTLALSNTAVSPRNRGSASVKVPPPSSPTQPAQKALDEFLQKNAQGGAGILDDELQEELLQQVEIEKRIKENQFKTANNAPEKGAGLSGQILTSATLSAQEKLKLELQNQHEIERSIREQHQLRQQEALYNANSEYTTSYLPYDPTQIGYSSSAIPGIPDSSYAYDMQLQMQIQMQEEQLRNEKKISSRKPKKTSATGTGGGLAHVGDDSESSDGYDGQLIDYEDGNNRDFFRVGKTNTFIETDTPERRSRKALLAHAGEYGPGGVNILAPSLPYQAISAKINLQQQQQQLLMPVAPYYTQTAGLPSATGATTTSPSLIDQQIEMQKQIFDEYERKKQQKQLQSRKSGVEAHLYASEATDAKQRLLKQQESLLSASSMDSYTYEQKKSARSERSHRTHHHRSSSARHTSSSKQESTSSSYALTTSHTEHRSAAGGGVILYDSNLPVSSSARDHREKKPNPALTSASTPVSPYRTKDPNSKTGAARGSESPILGDTTASISAYSLQRREQERREQQEREIELEWEREQERAVDLEKERERTLERERQQKKASQSGGRAQYQESEYSYSGPGLGSTGRSSNQAVLAAAALTATSSFNPFADSPNADELIIVKGGSAVSDLTWCTMSSGSNSDHEEERTTGPMRPEDLESAGIRPSAYATLHHQQKQLLQQQPPAAPVAGNDDPLLQSVALLLREALDPNVGSITSPISPPGQTQSRHPGGTPGSGPTSPAPVGSIDRAKALAAARLLISTLLGQSDEAAPPTLPEVNPATTGSTGKIVDSGLGSSLQISPASNPTQQTPTAQSRVSALPLTQSGTDLDSALSSEVFTELPTSYLLDDNDGLYSNYQSTAESPTRGRPPVLLRVETAELAEMSSTRPPNNTPTSSIALTKDPALAHLQRELEPRSASRDGLPPRGSPGGTPPIGRMRTTSRENEERPPHARRSSTDTSTQSRLKQSERVMQTLNQVSEATERYIIPDAVLNSDDSILGLRADRKGHHPAVPKQTVPPVVISRNTVALQSGISVITEDTFETSEIRRQQRERDRGRSTVRAPHKIQRSSSVAVGERAARAESRSSAIPRSTSADAKPRKDSSGRDRKSLFIDPHAPYIGATGLPTPPLSRSSSRQKAERPSTAGSKPPSSALASPHSASTDHHSHRHREEVHTSSTRTALRESHIPASRAREHSQSPSQRSDRSGSRQSSLRPGVDASLSRSYSSDRRIERSDTIETTERVVGGRAERPDSRDRSSRRPSEATLVQPERRGSRSSRAVHDEGTPLHTPRSTYTDRSERYERESSSSRKYSSEPVPSTQPHSSSSRRSAYSGTGEEGWSSTRDSSVGGFPREDPHNSSAHPHSSKSSSSRRYDYEPHSEKSGRLTLEHPHAVSSPMDQRTPGSHRSGGHSGGRSGGHGSSNAHRDLYVASLVPRGAHHSSHGGEERRSSAHPRSEGSSRSHSHSQSAYGSSHPSGTVEDHYTGGGGHYHHTSDPTAHHLTMPPPPGTHSRSRSLHDMHAPISAPTSTGRPVYHLDGLELTEEEMTFISRDMGHVSTKSSPKQAHTDYYPRGSPMRHSSSSGAKHSPPPDATARYQSIDGRPPDTVLERRGSEMSRTVSNNSRRGPPPERMYRDDYSVQSGNSSPYHDPRQLTRHASEGHRSNRTDTAKLMLEHRSPSSSNIQSPHSGGSGHHHHRNTSGSGSRGHTPLPTPTSGGKPSTTSKSSGSGSGKLDSQGATWSCSVCTLENPPSYLACDACGMVRGPHT